tara:strand:- start:1493 stop:1843 length:351 start_codon:yes stop_codon:yes gene_type:complete
MAQFLKIKSTGGGSTYTYDHELEFLVNVDNFTGFSQYEQSTDVFMALSEAFSSSNTGTTTLILEVADTTGVDTSPAQVVQETIIKTLLSNPGGKILKLNLPKNYIVKSWEVTGYIA